MTPHSSILIWEMPWTEEPGGLSPWGCKESDTTEGTEYTGVCVCVYLRVCVCILTCVCMCVLWLLMRRFSRVRLYATLWTAAHQAPLSTGFSRQEYRNGCHFLLQYTCIHTII